MSHFLIIAVGAALGFKMQAQQKVAVPFTGDAGMNTGNWHESLNMASIWKLPVVFALENNHYGVSTNIKSTTNIENFSIRAKSYGIPGIRVDGFDVVKVYEAAVIAVERARNGFLRPCRALPYRLRFRVFGPPISWYSRAQAKPIAACPREGRGVRNT